MLCRQCHGVAPVPRDSQASNGRPLLLRRQFAPLLANLDQFLIWTLSRWAQPRLAIWHSGLRGSQILHLLGRPSLMRPRPRSRPCQPVDRICRFQLWRTSRHRPHVSRVSSRESSKADASICLLKMRAAGPQKWGEPPVRPLPRSFSQTAFQKRVEAERRKRNGWPSTNVYHNCLTLRIRSLAKTSPPHLHARGHARPELQAGLQAGLKDAGMATWQSKESLRSPRPRPRALPVRSSDEREKTPARRPDARRPEKVRVNPVAASHFFRRSWDLTAPASGSLRDTLVPLSRRP